MIFQFLLPIIGWLVLFGACFLIYTKLFYKETESHSHVEGASFYMVLTTFFWIVVYMCISSIWSILYSLIDLKYPDVVGAVSDYGRSGFYGSGIVFDAFAFPLAMTVVSSITALILAFWLIYKFKQNRNLRPQRLYSFLQTLVYIGGAVLAFSGFVYVVYSWLYGNLPIAIFLKGGVAFVIVSLTALYFYLVGDGKNRNEENISRGFALILVLATLVTLYVSFQVVGTPGEARLYRLDSITVSNLQTIKNEIDNQDQNYGNSLVDLEEVEDFYVRQAIEKSGAEYSSDGVNYTLCADFNADMPESINDAYRDETWDYEAGYYCYQFAHKAPYPAVAGVKRAVE